MPGIFVSVNAHLYFLTARALRRRCVGANQRKDLLSGRIEGQGIRYL